MKLGDYGLLMAVNANSEKRTTTLHKAPEKFTGARELKSDVWSLGVTLIELAEGKNPYERVELGTIKDYVNNNDPPSLSSEKWSAEFVDFVSKCLVKDVKERWSVKQLMEVSDWEMDKGVASVCERVHKEDSTRWLF